jgi:signal transduction histidine kinase
VEVAILTRLLNAKNQKLSWSISLVQVASYLLIILVLSVTFGLLFFSTAKSHLENEVGRKLQDIARIAARNAPFERLSLIRPGNDSTRMVLRLKEKLAEIREATATNNIMIFRPDMSSMLDLRPEILIGSRYQWSHFSATFWPQLENGGAVKTGSYRDQAHKLTISAYVPVFDANHRLFAVAGVDGDTQEIEVIDQMRWRFFLIAGGGTCLAFGLSLALARRLTNPIREMAKTAENIGRGEYQSRVDIPAIRELAALADAINRMSEQVRNRDSKLKEISASVAHEIRNPLNSIKLLITLLDEEAGPNQSDSQKSTITTLHQEIAKLTRFLTEFLTFSRPIVIVQDEAWPREIINRVVELSAAEAHEREVNVIPDATDWPPIRCDRNRLEQAILDLTLNAIQAAGRFGTVWLRAEIIAPRGDCNFMVEDSGCGIAPEIKEAIFDPFFTTKETGTGLGLPNAQKIVAGHGGSLKLDDRPGGGTRSIIHLPHSAETGKGGGNGHHSDSR